MEMKKCYVGYISRSEFVKYIHAHFEQDNHYLRWLTKLSEISSVAYFISTF